ncbi:magnesium transporter [Chlorobium limicola]|uniref:Magnesium transport protein CorA n=1 Tax=Chlorobium limicola TaxID=1092 RepID=A0A117MQF9_CHLLI|nr:magnesium transporter [Chlorobium limicola]
MKRNKRAEHNSRPTGRPLKTVKSSLSGKIGQPAGTLYHTGRQKTESPVITVFGYDENRFFYRDVKTLHECEQFKEQFKVLWVNIDGLHEVQIIEEAGQLFGIHPLTLEDIPHTVQRPKIEEFDGYLFLVLKALELDAASGDVAEEQISMVIGSNFVLSFQEKPGDMFDATRDRIRNEGTAVRRKGADYLAYTLIDAVVDHYFTILEHFESRIEELDTNLLEAEGHDMFQSMYSLKKDLIHLRKSIWPLREIINSLSREQYSTLDGASIHPFFRDVYDNIILIIESVESYRDIVIGMHDTWLAVVNNRMNEIMKVLTIIATVFMPLSFIAGVYGMNFHYMPELEWHWGYFSVLGGMAVIFAGMMRYFHTKRWF